MLTASGKVYWPADPRPEDIFIEDVASHLAKLCRYTGACRKHYSIAEHSVLVSRMVSRPNALCALLHDGPEFVLNDMNRPTKRGPRMEGYRELEDINWACFAERFNLPRVMPEEVHEADHDALFHEQAAIMPPCPPGFEGQWGMGLTPPAVIRPELIKCWSWQDAERFFMNRYKELTR